MNDKAREAHIEKPEGPGLPLLARLYTQGRYTRASVDTRRAGQPLTSLANAAEWRQKALLRQEMINHLIVERDALQKQLAALQWAASQQAAEGWKPIETAPKDGRTILLGYFNSHGKWRTMRGQWISKEYIDEYWEDPEGVEAGWFETPVEAEDPPNCWPTDPTHWHHLPAPPATQGGADEQR
jgi:hypothetical protein